MELVSIISPTYNGEEHLPYFLDSILNQTYDKIQLIMIDDGSADGTFDVLNSYADKFALRGYEYIILRQSHSGQAAAVNNGLRNFSGSRLMWMDSDDMLEPSCIAEMTEWLNDNPDKDFVICDAKHVSYPDFSTKYIFSRKIKGKKDNYFNDILNGTHNYSLGTGSLLVRTEKLRRAIPQMQIFESRQGQNYQLMLPLLYFCKWGYLHKPLMKIVERPGSHSTVKRSYEEMLTRQSECAVIMKETIRRMNIPEQKKAFRMAENRFAHRSFELAFNQCDKKEMKKQMKTLLKNRALSFKEIIRFLKSGKNSKNQ